MLSLAVSCPQVLRLLSDTDTLSCLGSPQRQCSDPRLQLANGAIWARRPSWSRSSVNMPSGYSRLPVLRFSPLVRPLRALRKLAAIPFTRDTSATSRWLVGHRRKAISRAAASLQLRGVELCTLVLDQSNQEFGGQLSAPAVKDWCRLT